MFSAKQTNQQRPRPFLEDDGRTNDKKLLEIKKARWLLLGSPEAFTRAAVQLARYPMRVRFSLGVKSQELTNPSPSVSVETGLLETNPGFLMPPAHPHVTRFHAIITCTQASTSTQATYIHKKKHAPPSVQISRWRAGSVHRAGVTCKC